MCFGFARTRIPHVVRVHTQSFRSQTGPNKWYQSRSSIAQIKRTNSHRNPSDSESNLLRFVKFLHTFLFFTFLSENRKINSVFTVEIGWNFDMLCAYIWSMILQIFRSKFQAVWEKSVILFRLSWNCSSCWCQTLFDRTAEVLLESSRPTVRLG